VSEVLEEGVQQLLLILKMINESCLACELVIRASDLLVVVLWISNRFSSHYVFRVLVALNNYEASKLLQDLS
jgi:hypothetical protein